MPLPALDYPAVTLESDICRAVYELAIDGWSNDYCRLALLLQIADIERELKRLRDAGVKIVRPASTQVTFMRSIGIAAVISRYEFHMASGKKYKNDVALMAAERNAIEAIAKSVGRSPLWVHAMIRLYREHVIAPARAEIDGGAGTVRDRVKAA